MDLSGTDRSAVRLGYGLTILLLLMLGHPASAQMQAGDSRASSAMTANNSGEDRSASCCELHECTPVIDTSVDRHCASLEILSS